jgi:hypothetical protein
MRRRRARDTGKGRAFRRLFYRERKKEEREATAIDGQRPLMVIMVDGQRPSMVIMVVGLLLEE